MSGGRLVGQVASAGLLLEKEAVNYIVEDTRLSTLQRKLVKEDDPAVALGLRYYFVK